MLEAETWRLKGELRTANSLGRLNRDTGRAPDAREYLKKTLERFTEGFDAADLLEAELILKDLP